MNYTESNIPKVLQPNDIININYSGTYKEIALPKGRYKFECWGAQGGEQLLNAKVNNTGAYGGYTYGILELRKEHVLFIYVGQAGSKGSGLTGGSGGWNGGAKGGNDSGSSANDVGGGGGGATDVRLISGNWNDITSLKSRIMVAGGGGGSLLDGVGGGLIGGISNNKTPATQTSGYAFGYGEIGGNGGTGFISKGGGAGGYYGGYSVNTTGSIDDGAGGNGGSSFISGLEGCNAVDINGVHTNQPIHYSGLYFTECKTESGIRTGDGLVTITVTEPTKLEELILFEVDGKIKYIKSNFLYTLENKDIQTLTSNDFIEYGLKYEDIQGSIDLKLLFNNSKVSILKSTEDKKKIQYRYIIDHEPKLIMNKKPILLPYKKINKLLIDNDNILYLIQKEEVFYTYRYKYWGMYEFITPPPKYDKQNEENYIIHLSNWLNNINTKDINNIRRYGMTAETINNIPEENWNELFPYYLNRVREMNFLCILIRSDDFDIIELQKIKIYGDKFNRQSYVSKNLYLEEQEKTKYTITWNAANKNKIKILYGM